MRRLFPAVLLLALPVAANAQIGEQTGGSEPEAAPEAEAPARAASERPESTATRPPRAAATPGPSDERVLQASPSMYGVAGGFRTVSATGMSAGNFGLSLFGEYYGGTSVVRNDDTAKRFLGTLALAWTPIEYFEVAFSLGARATTNSFGRPELIQTVGDTSLALKGMYEVADGVHMGAFVRLNAPAGADAVGLDFGSIGADLLFLGTLDLQEMADAPVRVHLNAGYIVDRSSELFDRTLERVERFGQNVFDYSRAHIGLGVDAPLPYVTPSLEWTLQVPSGAACDSFNPQPCVSENGFASFPHYLTIGAKSAPLGPGLILNTGVDLGLTTAESQGTPAVPAWNWIFGIGYDLDPTPPATAAAVAPAPVVEAGPVSHVRGVIVDADSGAPINGARVSYPGLDYTDQITSTDGRFRSFDFTPGEQVTIELSHPAYEPRELSVTITETVREGQISLTAAFTGTRLTGFISFGGQAAPVSILLTGDRTYELEVPEGEANYVLDVEPGTYTMLVAAPGHTTEVMERTLELGRVVENIEFSALPSGADLRRTPAGVEVVDGSEGVTFDAEEALTAAGQGVLDELAALMQEDSSLRIRVRSHVDDRGDTELEQSLCQSRAQAVVDYLTGKGIAAGRLQAEPVGAIEPLFPNISDRNRRRNNRVEFTAIR